MNVWRWFGSMVFAAGLMVLVGANLSVTAQDKDKKTEEKKADEKKADEKKADEKKAEEKKPDEKKVEEKKVEEKKAEPKKEETKVEAGKVRMTWKAFEPKTVFYQKLVTKTVQDMTVMGQKITQDQSQTFYLKWTAEDKTKEGNYVVTQEIVGLNMSINIGGTQIAYDSTKKEQAPNPMTEFFKTLLGLKLKLTISPKMEVQSIEGQDEFVRKLSATNPQMDSLLKSILSKDALQQMAEPTWGALPDKDVGKGSTWDKTSILKLGPIGTYTTKFVYTYDGTDEKTKFDKIAIKSELKYAKPDDKAGALPFTIKEAKLDSTKGDGYALFDQAKGRFAESKMEMVLSGDLTIEVGNMETKVNLSQTQTAISETSDNPQLPAVATAPAAK